MQITLELPDDIVRDLESKWTNLTRAALESLGLEAYRSKRAAGRAVASPSWFRDAYAVDAFLKEHAVYDFKAADFEQDRDTLRQLRARKA